MDRYSSSVRSPCCCISLKRTSNSWRSSAGPVSSRYQARSLNADHMSNPVSRMVTAFVSAAPRKTSHSSNVSPLTQVVRMMPLRAVLSRPLRLVQEPVHHPVGQYWMRSAETPTSLRRPPGRSLVLNSFLPAILSGFVTMPAPRPASDFEFADRWQEISKPAAESGNH